MWHLKQKIKVHETIMNEIIAMKVSPEAENKEIVINKLRLSRTSLALAGNEVKI